MVFKPKSMSTLGIIDMVTKTMIYKSTKIRQKKWLTISSRWLPTTLLQNHKTYEQPKYWQPKTACNTCYEPAISGNHSIVSTTNSMNHSGCKMARQRTLVLQSRSTHSSSCRRTPTRRNSRRCSNR